MCLSFNCWYVNILRFIFIYLLANALILLPVFFLKINCTEIRKLQIYYEFLRTYCFLCVLLFIAGAPPEDRLKNDQFEKRSNRNVKTCLLTTVRAYKLFGLVIYERRQAQHTLRKGQLACKFVLVFWCDCNGSSE
jgi:hypothetical protein